MLSRRPIALSYLDGNALGIPNAFPWNCPVGMPAVGSAQTGVPGVPSAHSCVLKTTGGAAYITVRCQIRRENLPLSDSDRGEFLFGFEIDSFYGLFGVVRGFSSLVVGRL